VAELDEIITAVVDAAQDEWQRAMDEAFQSLRNVFDLLVSIRGYLPSRKYPGVPRIFEALIDDGLGALQTLAARVAQIPGRILLAFGTAAFSTPKHFHNRVMPLDEAIKLSVKLMVDQGLTVSAGAGVPAGLAIKKKVTGWIDTWIFLRYLNLSAGLRLVKARLVGLVIRIISLVFFYLGVVFFGVLIYRLWKFANDPANDQFFKRSTLRQDHPMVKDVELGRRRERG
jgi:hypothetical protein